MSEEIRRDAIRSCCMLGLGEKTQELVEGIRAQAQKDIDVGKCPYCGTQIEKDILEPFDYIGPDLWMRCPKCGDEWFEDDTGKFLGG